MAVLRPGDDPGPLTPEPGRAAGRPLRRPGDHAGRSLGHLRPRTPLAPPARSTTTWSPSPSSPPIRTSRPRSLASGHDFYAAPRLSPDGTRLAWITWDHPDMPWDHTELWVADARSRGRSVGPSASRSRRRAEASRSPSPAGRRPASSTTSRTGAAGGTSTTRPGTSPVPPATPSSAEPDWVFGNATYGFLPDGQLVAAWAAAGRRPRSGSWPAGGPSRTTFPFSTYAELQPTGDGAVIAIAASPTVAACGGPPRPGRRRRQVLRRSREVPIDEAAISAPEAVEFPTGGGEIAHALFYPPATPTSPAPDGRAAPADRHHPRRPDRRHVAGVQPGGAVLDQPGLRRGRRRLPGQQRLRHRPTGAGSTAAWGIADVEDCAARRRRGWPSRAWSTAAGRSSEAAAPAASPPWPPWPSPTPSPPGPATSAWPTSSCWPATPTSSSPATSTGWSVRGREAADEYRRRSPIHHVEQITCPLILFQGLEDAVVPPAQSELMYEALRDGASRSPTWPSRASSTGSARRPPSSPWPRPSWRSTAGCSASPGRRGVTAGRSSIANEETAQSSSVMACLGQRCTASSTLARSSSGGFSCSTYRKSSSRTSKTSGAAAMHRALLSHKS